MRCPCCAGWFEPDGVWYAPTHACAVHPVGLWRECCSPKCARRLQDRHADRQANALPPRV